MPPYAGADCQGVAVNWGAACLMDDLNGTFLRTRNDRRDRLGGALGTNPGRSRGDIEISALPIPDITPPRWGLRDGAVRLLIIPMPAI